MILLTGASGFLGRAVRRVLDDQGLPYAVAPGRREGNLREWTTAYQVIGRAHPKTVIHLAYPGTDGIGTSLYCPADLVTATLQIDLNVLRACSANGVTRLVTMGSVCSYPEQVSFPTGEDQLFQGAPEPVNAAYGHAKRMQLALLEAYRQQHDLEYTQLVLSNLYGPGDHSGHVIPATIAKMFTAKRNGQDHIVAWGDGTATREFLHVEDAARAVVMAARAPMHNLPINICSGEEIALATLFRVIAGLTGFTGEIRWDATKPNGQPRRRFSYTRAQALLGWVPQTLLYDGLRGTVEAFR